MIIVQIAGRLGRDPESRFTSSGLKVTTLTVATNVRKGGKEETVWWRVTVWGERLDKMIAHLKKGSAIIAIGEMHKPEIWTDKEGRPQASMELTADILRFSPFGGPERQQDQNAGGFTASPSQQNSYGADSGFGDYNTGAQGYGSPSYGSAAGQGMGTSPYAPTTNDDQEVPF